MIEGVITKTLKKISDSRGWLFEILRNDDEIFEKFGQVYITMCKNGIAKAWHYHKQQDDFFVCVFGKALVVLYDSRNDSPTFGELQEFVLSDEEPTLVKIPSMVIHGFTALSEEARIVNIPTNAYNHEKPDEFRLPWNSADVPYSWPSNIKDGD